MFWYRLGYYSHEESEYVVVGHDQAFSHAEFAQIVISASRDAIRTALVEWQDHDRGMPPFVFEEILPPTVEVLCLDYGFTRLQLEAEFEVNGWHSPGAADFGANDAQTALWATEVLRIKQEMESSKAT